MDKEKIKTKEDWLKFFLESYELIGFRIFKNFENNKKIFIGSSTEKKCRFCNTTDPSKFLHEAHLVPKFLGNIHFISNFECDACNSKFDDYEKSLSNFIGLIRYFEITENLGKKKILRYKDPSGAKIYMSERGMELDDPENKISSFDEKTNSTIFKVKKKPYTPLKIYKILLKIFLSYIGEKSFSNFSRVNHFLISNKLDFNFKILNYSCLIKYEIETSKFLSDYPIVYIYRRKVQTANFVPEATMLLCFKSLFYQIYILSDNDFSLFTNETNNALPLHPPALYDSKEYAFYESQPEIIDLSNNEELIDVEETLRMVSLTSPITREYNEEEWKKINEKYKKHY